MRTFIAALLLLPMMAAPVLAEVTVGELLDFCDGGDDAGSGVCTGLVVGVSGVMGVNCLEHRDGNGDLSLIATDTKNATYGAQIQAFKNWARANPQEWESSAVVGVAIALRELFPCN